MQPGALAGCGVKFESAVGEANALGGTGEAEGIVAGEGGTRIATAAAVGDLDMERRGVGHDGDRGGGGAGVAGDVGEGLLDEAKDDRFELGCEAGWRENHVEFERDAGLCAKASGMPDEGRFEPQIIEDARAKLERKFADGGEKFVGERKGLAECGRGGSGGLELKTKTGEQLADLIVEVLSQTTAFFLAGFEQASGQALGAILGGAAFAVFVFQIGGAGGDLVGEGLIEGGEFRGEAGVLTDGVAVLEGLVE